MFHVILKNAKFVIRNSDNGLESKPYSSVVHIDAGLFCISAGKERKYVVFNERCEEAFCFGSRAFVSKISFANDFHAGYFISNERNCVITTTSGQVVDALSSGGRTGRFGAHGIRFFDKDYITIFFREKDGSKDSSISVMIDSGMNVVLKEFTRVRIFEDLYNKKSKCIFVFRDSKEKVVNLFDLTSRRYVFPKFLKRLIVCGKVFFVQTLGGFWNIYDREDSMFLLGVWIDDIYVFEDGKEDKKIISLSEYIAQFIATKNKFVLSLGEKYATFSPTSGRVGMWEV